MQRYTLKILQYYVHISNTRRENSRFQRKTESRKNAPKEQKQPKDLKTYTHAHGRSDRCATEGPKVIPRTWQRTGVLPFSEDAPRLQHGCGLLDGKAWDGRGGVEVAYSPGTRHFNCSFALQSSLLVTAFVVYCCR